MLSQIIFPLFLINFIHSHNIDDESIKETWTDQYIEICDHPEKYFAANEGLISLRLRIDIDFIDVEIRSVKPLLVVVKHFALPHQVKRIEEYLTNKTLEKMKVVGDDNVQFDHPGRKADGIWIDHTDPVIYNLFIRMKRAFTLNPDIAEAFLILKYGVHGHYAPHYDHLDENPDINKNDIWMQKYGNRLATYLLLVKTATKGGGTIFPNLNLVVQPDLGDLIIWFNADVNNNREVDSMHGACPILEGEKIAVSLWVRRLRQYGIYSFPILQDVSYHPAQLFRFT